MQHWYLHPRDVYTALWLLSCRVFFCTWRALAHRYTRKLCNCSVQRVWGVDNMKRATTVGKWKCTRERKFVFIIRKQGIKLITFNNWIKNNKKLKLILQNKKKVLKNQLFIYFSAKSDCLILSLALIMSMLLNVITAGAS